MELLRQQEITDTNMQDVYKRQDLTSVDPTLKEGANVTLLGGQAETYVRSREFDPLDANMARMQRQQQYITAFAQKALQEMKGDLTLPLDLLNLVSENSVTNLSAPKITYLATKVSGSSFSSDNIYSIDSVSYTHLSGHVRTMTEML